MASYHFSLKIIGRSDGRSVVAAAAYRAGSTMLRAETGEIHDYFRKGGVMSADVLAPDRSPAWATHRSKFWNAVEDKENRKNSQLAREIEIALPNEFSEEQNRELALSWAQENLVDLGRVVDVCIHDPDIGQFGNRNKHAHILCSMREFDASQPDGWAKNKNRNWNDKSFLKKLRKSWADAQNTALENYGFEDRVDHRTLVEQKAAAEAAGDTSLAQALGSGPIKCLDAGLWS
jgi:hypothetical protein